MKKVFLTLTVVAAFAFAMVSCNTNKTNEVVDTLVENTEMTEATDTTDTMVVLLDTLITIGEPEIAE